MSDCPREIIDEILSYLHSECRGRPTLQDLRVGLTCKAWYKALHSTIIGVQIERLEEATEKATLLFHRLDPAAYSEADSMSDFKSRDFDSDWCTGSTPIETIPSRAIVRDLFYSSHDPDFDYSIVYNVYEDSAEQMWSLNSLLSRSRQCRRVQLLFPHSNLWKLRGEPARAFLRLMEICTQQARIEITIRNVYDRWHGFGWPFADTNDPLFSHEFTTLPAPRPHPPPKRPLLQRCRLWWGSRTKLARINSFGSPSEANIPASYFYGPNHWNDCVQVQSYPYRRRGYLAAGANDSIESRLSMLILSNAAPFSPILFPSLHNIAIHSSATVTRLHFSDCRLIAYDWNAVLSSWRFDRLSHFSIRDARVPFPSLISFLRNHPTLTAVTLLVHEFDGTAQVLTKDDFLPNVRRLVAAPALLVAILSPIFYSKSRTTGRLLPTLEALTISQEHTYFRPSRAVCRFDYTSKVLSLIGSHRARGWNSRESHLPKLHTLRMCILYPPKTDFEDWLCNLRPSFTHSTNSLIHPINSQSPYNLPELIANLPLRGIVQFQVSAYDHNRLQYSHYGAHMPVNPAVVVDAISCIFGGSTDLKKVVLTDIFTAQGWDYSHAGNMVSNEKSQTQFPPANIGRLWENCTELVEVELPGMAKHGLEEVWSRPTSTLE